MHDVSRHTALINKLRKRERRRKNGVVQRGVISLLMCQML